MSHDELLGRLENPITEELHGYAAVLLGETMGLAADVIRDQQAEIERLRGVLHRLACLGNGDRPGNSDGNLIAQAALAGGVHYRRADIPHLPAELVGRIRHKLEWLAHERNMFDMIEPQPEKWVALVADILAALEQKP